MSKNTNELKIKPTALGPVANTDTKLLIYGLFQKGRVLAQDGGRAAAEKSLLEGLRISTPDEDPVVVFYIESRRFLIRDSPRPATTYEQKTGGADGVKGA